MRDKIVALVVLILATLAANAARAQGLRGTLVVAVPVREGLVVCADKRLYNNDTGTFTDGNVKIRKVDDHSLFVATNTVGFYDRKTRTMASTHSRPPRATRPAAI